MKGVLMTISVESTKTASREAVRGVADARTTPAQLLLTFKEAMEFLRVSRSTLYRLMWSGQLRGHKVGSTWRFYQQDLLDVIGNPVDPFARTQSPEYEG